MLQDCALRVIAETNEAWAKLVKRFVPAGKCYNLVTLLLYFYVYINGIFFTFQEYRAYLR